MNHEKTTRDGATKSLRLLVVEDSPQDAEIAVREIRRGGFDVTWKRVETAEAMRTNLREKTWDIIVCDYQMPKFNGPAAIALLKETGIDIPLIIVSGVIGEETAVECMRSGAHDYVMKGNLPRLVPAIERELKEAESRRELKRLEEARRREQIMLSRTEGIAHIGSWEWDIATDTVTWSDELFRIFQRNPRAGAPSFADHPAFYHPDDMARLRQVVEVAVADGTPYEIELRAIRKDGETRVCMARGVAEMETGGREVRRLFGSLQDITERKAAQDALLAKNEELKAVTQQLWQAAKLATMGELASSIAHELNNPLATVSLRIESLTAQTSQDDKRLRELEIIGQEIERMGNLVTNLLQFSRRSQQQISTVDVREEIEKTFELVEYHLRKNNVKVIREFAPDVPFIHADRQQLRQLFLNLYTNAGDAMPQGGTLTVRVMARPEAKQVYIEIADTGAGIPPDILPKVMETFFTTKPEGKGTGLGLAICRRIAQEHQGTFDIVSEGIPGKGTRVCIALSVSNGSNAKSIKGE